MLTHVGPRVGVAVGRGVGLEDGALVGWAVGAGVAVAHVQLSPNEVHITLATPARMQVSQAAPHASGARGAMPSCNTPASISTRTRTRTEAPTLGPLCEQEAGP